MSRTFVIMEAAACHDGSLPKAFELIKLARAIGADACKFQWLSSPERLAARRRAPEYLSAYRTIAFEPAWLPVLQLGCGVASVEFMCTSYLPEDVAVVAPYVRRFKVSSFESQDRHFVNIHAQFEKPMILSAGMGADLSPVLEEYRRLAIRRVNDLLDIDVLHCVSAYPVPVGEINLYKLQATKRFHQSMFSGLSDHTKHPWTGALAVAAGARIVEFHARLDDTSPDNADYLVARTPDQAAEYVANIRLAEQMLGSESQTMTPCEADFVKYQAVSDHPLAGSK